MTHKDESFLALQKTAPLTIYRLYRRLRAACSETAAETRVGPPGRVLGPVCGVKGAAAESRAVQGVTPGSAAIYDGDP